MKNLSRNEIFSMLVLPLIAVAVRKLESKSSPMNLAITLPAESRKVKLPCLRLTRRTSGVNGRVGGVAAATSLGELPGSGAVGSTTDAALGTAADCAGAGTARARVEPTTVFSDGNSGNRHFPRPFCAQTTSGLINEICRMTNRSLKSD